MNQVTYFDTLEEAEIQADRIEAYGGECEIVEKGYGYQVIRFSMDEL